MQPDPALSRIRHFLQPPFAESVPSAQLPAMKLYLGLILVVFSLLAIAVSSSVAGNGHLSGSPQRSSHLPLIRDAAGISLPSRDLYTTHDAYRSASMGVGSQEGKNRPPSFRNEEIRLYVTFMPHFATL